MFLIFYILQKKKTQSKPHYTCVHSFTITNLQCHNLILQLVQYEMKIFRQKGIVDFYLNNIHGFLNDMTSAWKTKVTGKSQ